MVERVGLSYVKGSNDYLKNMEHELRKIGFLNNVLALVLILSLK